MHYNGIVIDFNKGDGVDADAWETVVKNEFDLLLLGIVHIFDPVIYTLFLTSSCGWAYAEKRFHYQGRFVQIINIYHFFCIILRWRIRTPHQKSSKSMIYVSPNDNDFLFGTLNYFQIFCEQRFRKSFNMSLLLMVPPWF